MSSPSIDFYNEALDALQVGNAPEALAAIVNSLTEDPSDTQTWQLYIVILNVLGRIDDARKATEKLKTMGLSEVDELLMKAASTASAGDLAGAIGYYEAALAIEPAKVEIRTGLALALMQLDKAEDALKAAEAAVALDPEDSQAQYALGHILRLSGKSELALEALTKAVTAEPDFMIALYEQGMVLAEFGKFEEALRNFETFLKASPGDPSAAEAIAVLRGRLEGTR
jgi:tetratricopeptide (TPR) repeat protein